MWCIFVQYLCNQTNISVIYLFSRRFGGWRSNKLGVLMGKIIPQLGKKVAGGDNSFNEPDNKVWQFKAESLLPVHQNLQNAQSPLHNILPFRFCHGRGFISASASPSSDVTWCETVVLADDFRCIFTTRHQCVIHLPPKWGQMRMTQVNGGVRRCWFSLWVSTVGRVQSMPQWPTKPTTTRKGEFDADYHVSNNKRGRERRKISWMTLIDD